MGEKSKKAGPDPICEPSIQRYIAESMLEDNSVTNRTRLCEEFSLTESTLYTYRWNYLNGKLGFSPKDVATQKILALLGPNMSDAVAEVVKHALPQILEDYKSLGYNQEIQSQVDVEEESTNSRVIEVHVIEPQEFVEDEDGSDSDDIEDTITANI